jgi:hypothetical protein
MVAGGKESEFEQVLNGVCLKGDQMRILVLICFSLLSAAFGQDASDYYNKPVHELQEKIWVQNTALAHTGGFVQCYDEIRQWANKNRGKLQFKSVTSVDSSGIVQLILHSDCRGLRSKGPVLEYYMVLNARTDSVKIEFWNIEPKSKECGALYRKSLKKEIADLISVFVDSAKYTHIPYKGFGDPQSQVQHKPDQVAKSDNITDSIFGIIKRDSIAQQRAKDSIASIQAQEDVQTEAPVKNLAAAQMAADSMVALVEADSMALHPVEMEIFKGQLTCRGKIDVCKRVDCLQFLLSNKLRSPTDVQKYLISLQKYCNDKCEMIMAARATLPDEDKYLAMAAFRRAREDCAKVQGLSVRILLSKEYSGSR